MNKNSYFCLMNIDYLAPPCFQWWPVSPLLQHRNLEQTSSSSDHLGLWGFSPKGTIKNVNKTKQKPPFISIFYNELKLPQRYYGSALKVIYIFIFAQKWLFFLILWAAPRCENKTKRTSFQGSECLPCTSIRQEQKQGCVLSCRISEQCLLLTEK